MKYRPLVRRAAKADIRAAARWDEIQRPGLGREYIAEVDAAVNRVTENPMQYQVLHRETRRAVVHRFPYGMFYRVEGSKIIVFCVSHLHRDPEVWITREGNG